MKWLTWNLIRNIITLHLYYTEKKKGYVIDYVEGRWEGIDESAFDHERVYLYIEDIAKTAIYCLRDAEKKFDRILINCIMDFEGFEKEKPIRSCSFLEFLRIYGEHVLKILSKES